MNTRTSIVENGYGVAKRFDFVKCVIDQQHPKSVLDIGCGTGANLTEPLSKIFPEVSFLGVDADCRSIEYAKANFEMENLAFCNISEISTSMKFDLIIASEVLEHVDYPHLFLRELCGRLSKEGSLLITIPNGYGSYELLNIAQKILSLIGVPKILSNLFGRKREDICSDHVVDTLADSPHINFFSFNGVCRLFEEAGLSVVTYKPKTFLCGWGIDRLFTSDGFYLWNSHVSNKLPPSMCSGWMFVLNDNGTPNLLLTSETCIQNFVHG